MDAVQLYHRVRRRWWVIALAVLACAAAAFGYLARAPKIYASRAVIQVQQQGQKFMNGPSPGEDLKSAEDLKTVEQGLTSQSLLLRVVRAAGLEHDPAFAKPKKDGSKYRDSELVEMFQAKLSVDLRRGTRLIDLVIEDRDPERAQALVKTFLSEYLAQSFEQQVASMKRSGDYLTGEARTLKAKLDASERGLQAYREQNPGVSLEAKQDITGEKLKELNLQLSAAKTARVRLEADLPRIHEALDRKDPDALLGMASISTDEDVAGLQTRIHTEEATFASLKEVFMEKHPRYLAEERRLQELREARNAALLRAAERAENAYANAKATEATLLDSVREQEQSTLQSDRVAIPYNVLAREVESDRVLYEAVLARMKETAAAQGFDENPVRVVEEPLIPARPVRPRSTLVLAAAILAGLVAGVALVLARDFVGSSLNSVDEVEDLLGLPVLTTVPKSRLIAQGATGVAAKPTSREAEAFRTLRPSLQLLEGKRGAGAAGSPPGAASTVLFTSANPGEGKTSCAYHYAVMLAYQGLRTLLIDADLRRATLTHRLAKDARKPGFVEAVSGQISVRDACQPTAQENLFLLAAGCQHVRVAELLAAMDFGAFLQEAGSDFERVVIDTSPVNAVSDALLIARHVPVICLVIGAGRSPTRAVVRACALLQQAAHQVTGVILNRVSDDARSAYDNYQYTKDYVGSDT